MSPRSDEKLMLTASRTMSPKRPRPGAWSLTAAANIGAFADPTLPTGHKLTIDTDSRGRISSVTESLQTRGFFPAAEKRDMEACEGRLDFEHTGGDGGWRDVSRSGRAKEWIVFSGAQKRAGLWSELVCARVLVCACACLRVCALSLKPANTVTLPFPLPTALGPQAHSGPCLAIDVGDGI